MANVIKGLFYASKKKLESEKGVSLIFALVFFVICGAIGANIIVSASAAAGRTNGVIKTNQDFHTVVSATKLFEKKWRIGKVTITGEPGNSSLVDSVAGISGEDFYTATFLGKRDMLVKEVYDTGHEASMSFYISLNEEDENKIMKDVLATATVYTDYLIVVEFSVIDDSSNGSVSLRYDSVYIPDDGEGNSVIAWNKPSFLVGGGFGE